MEVTFKVTHFSNLCMPERRLVWANVKASIGINILGWGKMSLDFKLILSDVERSNSLINTSHKSSVLDF